MAKIKDTESLYMRILLVSTAAVLAFVLAVFIVAGGAFDADRPAPSDDETSAHPESGDAGEEKGGYIPVFSDASLIMNTSKLDAENAVLVDLTAGSVIASYKADERIFPASMTKIMTLIVAAENLTDLDEAVRVPADIVSAAYEAGASVVGFAANERVTVRDLIYGAAMPSGADATDTLARRVAGSEEKFAEMMNKKAEQLGLVDTHFVNASGLHSSDHYSTVREIAAILGYAMEIPVCRDALSAQTYVTSVSPYHPQGITLYNTAFSRMSTKTFGGVTVIAAKSGYTPEAMFCLAGYGEGEGGRRYILVTAGGSNRYGPVYDCKYVYEAFAQ